MSNVHKSSTWDVAIIGAGAAGLAAAIAAAEQATPTGALRILLLDGAHTIGAKILVSGGGRCNVTHHEVSPTDFFGNRRIIKNVLAAFPVENTITWFTSMGVNLKREDTGKLFPVTDKSRTVLNALLERCRERGVAIRPDHRVTDIEHSPDTGFAIRHSQGTLHAKKVILATGGRSLPKSGSDGSGYELARRLGHQVTATVPALVPLVLDDQMFHKTLSGLSQEVELTTVVGGRTVDQRTGSLLWTHFGISGPVVMDASRFWCVAREQNEAATVYGNFVPGHTQEDVREWFMEETRAHPRRTLSKTLAQRLPQRFAESLTQYADCDGQAAIAQLPRKDRDHLLGLLTKFPLPIVQDRGWNYAEVTAGGVPLEEINFRTMESKVVPGLYLVGEILDCDGRIGGFNFQWAWATGRLAGTTAAEA
ncbi:MAG: NAD(P)/FAD-dependent oxidoreductase [Nitrospira sp.]|nr:NAD(P)/FAD-dependent oxidoreductase [Nitrospira sp.]MDH5624776.1 NAD(P)/FAD-dependent oxidoreductase [Nitrospira sp.]